MIVRSSAGLAPASSSPADGIACGAVPSQPLLEHAPEHEDLSIHAVVDPDLSFPFMQPVQPGRVLDERALPGHGGRKEERVEAGVVESFPDVAAPAVA